MDGYIFIRNDRCRKGGGVGLYVRSGLQFKVRSDLIVNTNPNIKCCWIELNLLTNKQQFLVCSKYRLPSANTFYYNAIFETTENAMSVHENIVLLGDYTMDDIVSIIVQSHTLTICFNYDKL